MSISQRLFVALFGLAVVVIGVTIGLSRWSFEQGFLDYVNAFEQTRLERLSVSIAAAYRRSPQTWTEEAAKILNEDVPAWSPPDHPPPPRRGPGPVPHGEGGRPLRRGPPGGPGVLPPRGGPPDRLTYPPTGFFGLDGRCLAGDATVDRSADNSILLVTTGDVLLGELRSAPPRAFTSPQQTQVLQSQQTTTLMIGALVLLSAALLSWLLSRTLLAPIHNVVGGVRALSAGHYDSRLEHQRKDELGALADDVNRLAETLQASTQAQRKWIASISHELRTPVAVLVGEIQALKDGIRAFTPAQLESFECEVERLRRLIDDLYQLSLTEVGALRYQMEAVKLAGVVEAAVGRHRALAPEFEIRFVADEAEVFVEGDPVRLGQLCDNLLSNAVAYTDTPGVIAATVKVQGDRVVLTVDDSPPSVPERHLERIFEALYRQEESRNRKAGGAGLGLAICKNIVDAHRGEIEALASPLGGLRISATFPVREGTSE